MRDCKTFRDPSLAIFGKLQHATSNNPLHSAVNLTPTHAHPSHHLTLPAPSPPTSTLPLFNSLFTSYPATMKPFSSPFQRQETKSSRQYVPPLSAVKLMPADCEVFCREGYFSRTVTEFRKHAPSSRCEGATPLCLSCHRARLKQRCHAEMFLKLCPLKLMDLAV